MGRKKKIIEVATPEVIEVEKVEVPTPVEVPVVEKMVEVSNEETVKSKLAEIGKAVNSNTDKDYTKGTSIEEAIKLASNTSTSIPTPTPTPISTPVSTPIAKGRHKKDCTCERCNSKKGITTPSEVITPEGEAITPPVVPTSAKFDTIALMVNSTVVPIVSKRWNKDVKGVMLKDDQIDHLLTIKPESNMDKPSWVNYTLTAVSMLVMNFMTADSGDDKKAKVLNESIKIFNKMTEEEKEMYVDLLKLDKNKNG